MMADGELRTEFIGQKNLEARQDNVLQRLRRYFREKLAVLLRPHQNSDQTFCWLFSLPSRGELGLPFFISHKYYAFTISSQSCNKESS